MRNPDVAGGTSWTVATYDADLGLLDRVEGFAGYQIRGYLSRRGSTG